MKKKKEDDEKKPEASYFITVNVVTHCFNIFGWKYSGLTKYLLSNGLAMWHGEIKMRWKSHRYELWARSDQMCLTSYDRILHMQHMTIVVTHTESLSHETVVSLWSRPVVIFLRIPRITAWDGSGCFKQCACAFRTAVGTTRRLGDKIGGKKEMSHALIVRQAC